MCIFINHMIYNGNQMRNYCRVCMNVSIYVSQYVCLALHATYPNHALPRQRKVRHIPICAHPAYAPLTQPISPSQNPEVEPDRMERIKANAKHKPFLASLYPKCRRQKILLGRKKPRNESGAGRALGISKPNANADATCCVP